MCFCLCSFIASTRPPPLPPSQITPRQARAKASRLTDTERQTRENELAKAKQIEMARERRERRLQNEEFARQQKAYEELCLKEAVVHAVDVLGWMNVTQHDLEPLVSHSSDASLKDSSFLPYESMVTFAMRLMTPVLEIVHSQLSESFAKKRSAFQKQIDDLDKDRNGGTKRTALPLHRRLCQMLSLYRSFDFEDLKEFFAVAILHPLSHGHKGNLVEYLKFFKNEKKHTVLSCAACSSLIQNSLVPLSIIISFGCHEHASRLRTTRI